MRKGALNVLLLVPVTLIMVNNFVYLTYLKIISLYFGPRHLVLLLCMH